MCVAYLMKPVLIHLYAIYLFGCFSAARSEPLRISEARRFKSRRLGNRGFDTAERSADSYADNRW